MEKTAFIETMTKAMPVPIVYHYKPIFESLMQSVGDYQTTFDVDNAEREELDKYLSNDDFINDFCDLVYGNLDKTISIDELAVKLETIQASTDMLVGCLEHVESFADKTGEFATQNKITRRLLQNVMSFILYLLSQITAYNSELEKQLIEKSDTALLPYGFGE